MAWGAPAWYFLVNCIKTPVFYDRVKLPTRAFSRVRQRESQNERGEKGEKGEREVQHASRNTQAASILLFFLLSFFYLRPSPRETRVFRSFKFSYSKPLSLSLSLSVWQEKSRENLPRFDKFFSHKKPQFSTSPYIEFQFFESNLGN